MDIHIAPIVFVVDPPSDARASRIDVTADLLSELSGIPLNGVVSFRKAAVTAFPTSLLEVLRLCEEKDYDYVIYGYVRHARTAISLELKLVDREARAIAVTFMASDGADKYDRLIRDGAGKIAAYFRDELGFGGPDIEAEPERNALSIPVDIGYWTPLGGDWGARLAGVARIGAGARLTPVYPTFVMDSRDGYIAVTARLEYAIGLGEDGFEQAFLHSAIVGVGADVGWNLDARNAIVAEAGALVRSDFLSISKKYEGVRLSFSAAPGLYLGAGYRYAVNDRVALGASLRVDAVFYEPILFILSPSIASTYRLGGKE
jgi:TolB-like protein